MTNRERLEEIKGGPLVHCDVFMRDDGHKMVWFENNTGWNLWGGAEVAAVEGGENDGWNIESSSTPSIIKHYEGNFFLPCWED